jgi:hypothetical protein|tara:strand:+ start:1692 stop:1877 length:186 start_codon:yes stop_codon:yes gene_type:complete
MSVLKVTTTVQEARAKEYPGLGEQLDALMKGLDAIANSQSLPVDTTNWIAACKAVKSKYPK